MQKVAILTSSTSSDLDCQINKLLSEQEGWEVKPESFRVCYFGGISLTFSILLINKWSENVTP